MRGRLQGNVGSENMSVASDLLFVKDVFPLSENLSGCRRRIGGI